MGDVLCAEKTTCIGRQSLRLMISHFNNIGYTPIVGDSVTADTPLFIKYNDNNLIGIKPISEIIDESQLKTDELGREYDYSKKPYKVLCRSGWSDVHYVYRHETNKPIYTVSEGDMSVDVTEDHSLFDENKNEVKPSEINSDIKLEYYNGNLPSKVFNVSDKVIKVSAKMVANGTLDRVPSTILNGTKDNAELFLSIVNKSKKDNIILTKTCQAGLLYLSTKE